MWMISASFSILILTYRGKLNSQSVLSSPLGLWSVIIAEHCLCSSVFHAILQSTDFLGVLISEIFLSYVSLCLYTNLYCKFLPVQLILARIRQICLKVPSPKLLTCTNLLWLCLPMENCCGACGPSGFHNSLSLVSVVSDLIFTAPHCCNPATLLPGANAHLGCCVDICHQTNLFMVNLQYNHKMEGLPKGL